jgi:hypothetical protein
MSSHTRVSLRGIGPRLAAVGAAAIVSLVVAGAAVAALQGNPNTRRGQLLVGRDNDEPSNTTIQPPGVGANQSLRKGDQLIGSLGSDVLIGRLGPDTLLSGRDDVRDRGDVMVGGLERGSDVTAFPNFDIARGGQGDDSFLWAPGDGSDAFIGAERARFRRAVVRRRTVRVRTRPDTDTLIVGTMLVSSGDNSRPQLFRTRFGRLPRSVVSNGKLPATIGDSPPQPAIPSSCQVVAAPAGLGYQFLVRVFNAATGVQAVTIRLRNVEQVLCGSRTEPGITRTTLGRRGGGPVVVRTTNFTPRKGSKLDALVD